MLHALLHFTLRKVAIIRSTLDMRAKKASDVMTVIDDVFMLPVGARISSDLLLQVAEEGHSRVPVYTPAPSIGTDFWW